MGRPRRSLVRGALVKLAGEHRKLEARTTADGAFRFTGLRPGSYTLDAAIARLTARASTDLAKEGDRDGVQLRLAPAALAKGTVKGQDGVEIAHAKVRLSAIESYEDNPPEGSTTKDGRFEIELVGIKQETAPRRGPRDTRIARLLRDVEAVPRRDRDALVRTIEAFLTPKAPA